MACVVAVSTVTSLAGCARPAPAERRYTRRQPIFGTLVTITVYDRSRSKAARAVRDALRDMAAVERVTNNYDPHSEISQLNGKAGSWQTMSAGLAGIVHYSLRRARETGGTFDPTVWPLTRLWDFGRRPRVPSDAQIKRALRLVGHEKVKTRPAFWILLPLRGMGLDLSGVAKGYAVEEALSALRRNRIRRALVTTGSTTAVFGGKPDGSAFKVGIENPRAPGQLIGVVTMRRGVVSSSGDYQNYFVRNGVRYHHILDPRTGRPVAHTIGVTVVGESCPPTSDALSTAFFVMGIRKTARYLTNDRRRGVVFVTRGRRVRVVGNKTTVSGLARRV